MGYARLLKALKLNSQGVCKIAYTQEYLIFGRIFDLGGHKGVTTLILGSAERYNFGLGVH